MVTVVDKWCGGSVSGTFYSETVWWAVWRDTGRIILCRPHISAYLGIHGDIVYIKTTLEVITVVLRQPATRPLVPPVCGLSSHDGYNHDTIGTVYTQCHCHNPSDESQTLLYTSAPGGHRPDSAASNYQ
jgi:hypothetical protein